MIKSELQLKRNPFIAVILSFIAALMLLLDWKVSAGGGWSINLVRPFAGDSLTGFGWLLMIGGVVYLFISMFSFAKTALWLLLLPMGLYSIGAVLRAMNDSAFFVCLAVAVIGAWAYFMAATSEKDGAKNLFVILLCIIVAANIALCFPAMTKAIQNINSDFTPLLCYAEKDAAGTEIWQWNLSYIIHEITLFLSVILTLLASTRQYETETEDSRQYAKNAGSKNTFDTEANVKKKNSQSESNERNQNPSYHELKKDSGAKDNKVFAETVINPEPVVTVPVSGSRLQKSLKEEIVYDRDQKLEHKNVVRVFSVIGMVISFLMMVGGILLLTNILPSIQYDTICGVLLITVGVGLFCVFGNNLTYKEYYMKTIVTERKVVHEETNWEEVLANRLEEDEKNIASLTETYARMTEMYGKLLESTAELSNNVKALGMKEQPVLTDIEAQRQAIEEAAAAERKAQEEMLAAQQAAADRIAAEREALERAKAEREAIEKEAAARLVAEHEAIEREAARLAAEREAFEREAEQRAKAEREALEREAEQRAKAEQERIEKEALEMAAIEREAAERINSGETLEDIVNSFEQPFATMETPEIEPLSYQEPIAEEPSFENPTFDLFADVTVNKSDEPEKSAIKETYELDNSTDVEQVLSDEIPDTFDAYVEEVTSSDDDSDFPDTAYQNEELAEPVIENEELTNSAFESEEFTESALENEEFTESALENETIEEYVSEEPDTVEEFDEDAVSEDVPAEPIYPNVNPFASQREYDAPLPFHAPVKESEKEEENTIEDIIPPIERTEENADLLVSMFGASDKEESKPFFNNSFYASLADENPVVANNTDNSFAQMIEEESDSLTASDDSDKQSNTAFGFFSAFSDREEMEAEPAADTENVAVDVIEEEDKFPNEMVEEAVEEYFEGNDSPETSELIDNFEEQKPVSTEREIIEDFVLPTFRGFGFESDDYTEEQQEEDEFFKPSGYKMKSFAKKPDTSWQSEDDDDDFGTPVTMSLKTEEALTDDEPELPMDDEPELPMDDEPELPMDDEPELPMDDEPELPMDDEPSVEFASSEDAGDRLRKLQAKLAEIRQKNSEKYQAAESDDDLDE